MSPATKRTPARPPARKATTGSQREAALERLERSLDAADEAIRALRRDMTAGGDDLMQTVEKAVKDARKDTVKLGKAVRADVAKLQRAITDPPAKKKQAAARRTAASRRKTPPAHPA